jgi:lysophospholipase L1-like esterase
MLTRRLAGLRKIRRLPRRRLFPRKISAMNHPLLVAAFVSVWALSPVSVAAAAPDAGENPGDLLGRSRRIMFLGDSITASARYVAYFDAWLATRKLDPLPIVFSAGLPSETISGLSEDGHAGGKFPRPDLFERLDRLLPIAKPDLVFACYGINCGIYQPFDDERFARYQQGWRRLKEKVEAAGAKLIVITPPFYDDRRNPAGDFSYNEVLDRYATWLVDRRNGNWNVIDLHMAMTREVMNRRETIVAFTFQPDAVHPNDAGHWFMASELIGWFGDEKSASAATPQAMLELNGVKPEALDLVQRRVNVLRDAYVGAAGHKRPGVAAGLPISEAEAKYTALTHELWGLAPLSRP